MNNLNLINNMPEPELFQRNGRVCYFDEVSKLLRIKTPEETVRQKLIKFLHEQLQIPLEAMEIEVPMSHFKKGAKGRMDLIVYGISEQNYIPVMLIECKTPLVHLTDDVYNQADNYAKIVDAPIVGVTNGTEFVLDYWDESRQEYQQITTLPKYNELCAPNKLKKIHYKPYKHERFNYANSNNKRQLYDEAIDFGIIGEETPKNYVSFILNLYDCLMDDSVKCENIHINDYKSIKDMGIRFTNFGNAAGLGGYTGYWRYFMLENNTSNTQIVSFAIFCYSKTNSILIVAIDDYNSHHASLQLSFETNIKLYNDTVDIWHNGKMAVGRIGSAKSADVIKYISEQEEELVSNNKIFLGSLDNSKPLFMNSEGVAEFLGRIIKYSFLRDEYRNIEKSNFKKQKK